MSSIEQGCGDICFDKFGLSGGGLTVEKTSSGDIAHNVKVNAKANASQTDACTANHTEEDASTNQLEPDPKIAFATGDGQVIEISADSPMLSTSSLLNDMFNDNNIRGDYGPTEPMRVPFSSDAIRFVEFVLIAAWMNYQDYRRGSSPRHLQGT